MQNSLHFIEEPGLWLSVRAGELALRQRDGHYVELDRRVKIIVSAARGFCVTAPAIRYCGARHIELLISDNTAAFVSLFAPTALGDARRTTLKVREHQFRAAFDRKKNVEIARAIVVKKVLAEDHRWETKQAFMTELQKAKTVDNVRHIEARAAQMWWRQWIGFEMLFTGTGVPAEWRSWPGRYIGRRQGLLGELAAQFTARSAIHPIQALLNFATAIAIARLTRTIIAVGLDPAFGFLHDGRKPGRLSLVWDCIEPLRPRLVNTVFEYARSHEFVKHDFLIFVHKTTLERTIRLTPHLAKEIAIVTIKTVSLKECMKIASWITQQIRS